MYQTLPSVVRKYLDIFFSGQDQERLFDVLADDLIFEGPFLQCRSAREYVQQLVTDPCIDCDYKILHAEVHENIVTIIYQFIKPDINVVMTQKFEVGAGANPEKIGKIKLEFDKTAFGA